MVDSVWLTVQLFLQPQTLTAGRTVRDQSEQEELNASCADKTGLKSQDAEWLVSTFKGRDSASANAFLAALLRLWSVETGAKLYMDIWSRRRAPPSCTFTFDPTPMIVAGFLMWEERKKEKNAAL